MVKVRYRTWHGDQWTEKEWALDEVGELVIAYLQMGYELIFPKQEILE